MDVNPTIDKQTLVYNIVSFLQEELQNGCLSEEKNESIEVAMQCLETAFDLDTELKERLEKDKVNLLGILKAAQKSVKIAVTEQDRLKAEEYKNEGNINMKTGNYMQAIKDYTNAINLNPNNAIYFCNRAAAHSRLDNHFDAITDCNEAIKLDPTYGKAYGRLGIAYSNLNQYGLAKKALVTALRYDPENAMYETNLKLAEEKLGTTNVENAAPPQHRPVDISQFINNPNIINMATQMLSDPNFCNIMSGLMSGGQAGDSNIDALFEAGQTLTNRMQAADPNLLDSLRRNLTGQGSSGAGGSQENSNAPGDKSDTTSKPGPDSTND